MTNEIAKSETQHELDGFGGFTDAVEGIDAQLMSGVSLLGLKLKYLAPLWTDPDEQEVKVLLVAHDILRKVQKWIDGRPVETIVLAPGQPWPDIEKMNDEMPARRMARSIRQACGALARRTRRSLLRP